MEQFTRRLPLSAVGTALQRKAGTTAALTAALAVPAVVGTKLPIYTAALGSLVIFLSLGLLVRTSGMISLCQVGFAAVGAAAFSHLAHGLGVPWFAAVLLAGAITVPVGAVVAIPAIRLTGVYLAIGTFGFGIVLADLVYTSTLMFGSGGSLVEPRPSFAAQSDTAYYYVVLAFAVAAIALVVLIERSRLGRLLRALADSPLALASHGTNTNTTRVLVFCISAFLAGVGGALSGPVFGTVAASSFPFFNSLVLVAVLVVVGRGTLRSAILATVTFFIVPVYVGNPTFNQVLPIVFGLLAVLTAAASSGSLDTSRLVNALSRTATRGQSRAARSPAADRLAGLLPADLLTRGAPAAAVSPKASRP